MSSSLFKWRPTDLLIILRKRLSSQYTLFASSVKMWPFVLPPSTDEQPVLPADSASTWSCSHSQQLLVLLLSQSFWTELLSPQCRDAERQLQENWALTRWWRELLADKSKNSDCPFPLLIHSTESLFTPASNIHPEWCDHRWTALTASVHTWWSSVSTSPSSHETNIAAWQWSWKQSDMLVSQRVYFCMLKQKTVDHIVKLLMSRIKIKHKSLTESGG